jgi:hypothetical protein
VNSAEAISHLEALRARGATYLLFPSTAFWWFDHYADFKRHLNRHYREIAARPDICVVFDLQATKAARAQPAQRNVQDQRRQQHRQIRQLVGSVLPQNARVIVAIDGDDDLLDLDGRPTRPLLERGTGIAAVAYPGSSAELIGRLEMLYEQGARYVVIPSTVFWWLEHYPAFADYLERRQRTILRQQHICAIFELARPRLVDGAAQQDEDDGGSFPLA